MPPSTWGAPTRPLSLSSKPVFNLEGCRRTRCQSDEKGPAARRRPRAAREAYFPYVPLGGGLLPPSETSPQDSLRRQSRRSKAEHFHVGRRATNEDSHGPALNGPVRARASPAQPIPGGGFGGGHRGPLRWNEADGPFSAAWAAPVESVADDHLDDQAVGGGCEPDSHAGIELPLGPEVQVDDGEDLVLLLPESVESADWTKPGIVLEARADPGGEGVTDLQARRELEAAARVLAFQRQAERGIEGDVPGPPLLVDDGADGECPRVGGERAALVVDLDRQAQPDRRTPAVGSADLGLDTTPGPLPSAVGLHAGEDKEASLQPRGPSLGDPEGLVKGALRGQETVLRAGGALRRDIAEQLDQGAAGRDRLGARDLDLEGVLGSRGRREEQTAGHRQRGGRRAGPKVEGGATCRASGHLASVLSPKFACNPPGGAGGPPRDTPTSTGPRQWRTAPLIGSRIHS